MEKKFKLIKRKLDSDAVSSAISLSLVFLIFFAATGAVMVWGPAYVESEERKHEIESTMSQYGAFVNAIDDLVGEGNGANYIGDFVIKNGDIKVDSEANKIIVSYSVDPSKDIILEELEDDDGTFYVEGVEVTKAKFFELYDTTCFLSGTKIIMADGSLRNIESIKPGDLVLSFEDDRAVISEVKSLLS